MAKIRSFAAQLRYQRRKENCIIAAALFVLLLVLLVCAPSHAGTITLNDGCLPKLIVSTAKAHPINLPHSDAKPKADPLAKLLRKKRAKRKVYSDIGRCSAPDPIVPTWFATIDTPSFEIETGGTPELQLPPGATPTDGPVDEPLAYTAPVWYFGEYDSLGGYGDARNPGRSAPRELPGATPLPVRPRGPGSIDSPPDTGAIPVDGDPGVPVGIPCPPDMGPQDGGSVPKVDVPEPDTAPLLVLGLIAVAISQRRGLRKVGGLQTR